MSEERELTTIRTLPWDGTKDDWRMWSTKFEMRAKQRGYAKILTGVQTGVPNPNEEEPTDEALKKLYKLQANGYCDLLLAMKDKASFNLVKEANSHLHEAWEALKTKYAPSTKADTVRLMAQFQTSKLENVKHDVDEWVSSVEILRQELKGLGKTIDDDDFIIQILAGLPEEYMEITHSLTKDLESGTLTPKKMRAELKDRYKTMKGFNKWSDKDVALNMTDKPQQGGGGFKKHYKKPFKGRCNNCGKIGHKAADCWDREENKSKRPNNWKSPKKPDNNNNNNNNNNSGGSGRFGGKCWNCGERGHTSANCPKKDNDEVNIANEKVQDHVLLCYEVIEQPAAEVLPISVDDIDLAAAVPDAFWDDFEMIDTESDDIVSGPDGTSTMELNLLEEWINTPSKNNPHSFGCMGMHTTTTCSKLEPKHKADHEAEHDSDDELCKLNFDNMQETETCKLNWEAYLNQKATIARETATQQYANAVILEEQTEAVAMEIDTITKDSATLTDFIKSQIAEATKPLKTQLTKLSNNKSPQGKNTARGSQRRKSNDSTASASEKKKKAQQASGNRPPTGQKAAASANAGDNAQASQGNGGKRNNNRRRPRKQRGKR